MNDDEADGCGFALMIIFIVWMVLMVHACSPEGITITIDNKTHTLRIK